jgi:hypothetical protein
LFRSLRSRQDAFLKPPLGIVSKRSLHPRLRSDCDPESAAHCAGPMWTWTLGKSPFATRLQRVKRPDEEKGRLVMLPPKSEKSRRTIELPAVCVTALRAHQERQKHERALAGTRWKETEHVFTSTIGTAIDDRKSSTRW